MSEHAGTPGPWSIHNTRMVIDPEGHVVCVAHDTGPLGEADARLIAAAPETYEALAELLAHARAYSRAPHADALYKADSALRKAEGRQP